MYCIYDSINTYTAYVLCNLMFERKINKSNYLRKLQRIPLHRAILLVVRFHWHCLLVLGGRRKE